MKEEIKITCKECGNDTQCKMDCGSKTITSSLRFLLNNMDKLTDRQLSSVSFEVWVEAQERALKGV